MDPAALILIIVFIVAPLIERLLKAGKGAQQPDDPPQQRMPPQRPPQHRIPQRVDPQAQSPAERQDDAAAAMLPDDLWEILTGERRTPLPAPVPANDEEYEEEAYSLEDEAIEEYASGEMLPAPAEPVSLETYVRPVPEREAPRVVSLEQLEFDDRARHDAFHDRLDNLRPAARVRRPPPHSYRFTSDEDLRRAIVMNEILGPPKGLE